MIECRDYLWATVLITRDGPASDVNFGCTVAGLFDERFELSTVQPNTAAFWTVINFNPAPLRWHQFRSGADRALPWCCKTALGVLPMQLYLHFD